MGKCTTNLETGLFKNDRSSGRLACRRIGSQVAVIEPVVCIQSGGAIIPVAATVILVGTTLRNELDLKRSFSGTFGARISGRRRYFSDGVRTWTNIGKEPVAEVTTS